MNIELYHQTLQKLFNKYFIDISVISYNHYRLLDGDLTNYFIASRGDGMGIVVINIKETNSFASLKVFPITQLLQLKVDIASWNEYSWGKKKMNEEDIVLNIFGTFVANYK